MKGRQQGWLDWITERAPPNKQAPNGNGAFRLWTRRKKSNLVETNWLLPGDLERKATTLLLGQTWNFRDHRRNSGPYSIAANWLLHFCEIISKYFHILYLGSQIFLLQGRNQRTWQLAWNWSG